MTDRNQGKKKRQPATESPTTGRPGRVTAHHGHLVEVEDDQGVRWRCQLRMKLEPLVVGDHVYWEPTGEPEGGVVVAVQPRTRALVRPDPHGRLKAVAANVDLMVVVFAPLPAPSSILLDRYLVAAELSGIEPQLVLNKKELLQQESDSGGGVSPQAVEELLRMYRETGYSVLEVSAHEGEGLETLRKRLTGHTAVLVGQSGVGKSALVNALLPAAQRRTGEVSKSGLGQHTTADTRLFHLPGLSGRASLIDSPGIREFGLWHIDEEELLRGYRELAELSEHCRFRNCSHRHEPGCAIRQAAEEGRIHPRRLENFFRIADTLDPERKQRY